MRRLHFTYEMEILYSEEVSRCNFTIKCIPQNTSRQKIEQYKISLFPANVYCMGKDGLRNVQIYGVNEKKHDRFVFQIEGIAVTGLAGFEEEADEDIAMIFGHPYGLNVPGKEIQAYYEKNKPEESLTSYEKAIELMHALHRDFQYQPCTTDVDTTAEDAFIQGYGVCQDYAHIYIALMHLAGIPARYVTGLIVGEGASHAWVEILWKDRWYGLDPTNDLVVKDDHIKIGIGRDAKDCMINRGIMHGNCLQTQRIKVSVKDIEENIE